MNVACSLYMMKLQSRTLKKNKLSIIAFRQNIETTYLWSHGQSNKDIAGLVILCHGWIWLPSERCPSDCAGSTGIQSVLLQRCGQSVRVGACRSSENLGDKQIRQEIGSIKEVVRRGWKLHRNVWPDRELPKRRIAKKNRKAVAQSMEDANNLLDERTVPTSIFVVILAFLLTDIYGLHQGWNFWSVTCAWRWLCKHVCLACRHSWESADILGRRPPEPQLLLGTNHRWQKPFSRRDWIHSSPSLQRTCRKKIVGMNQSLLYRKCCMRQSGCWQKLCTSTSIISQFLRGSNEKQDQNRKRHMIASKKTQRPGVERTHDLAEIIAKLYSGEETQP